jgi:phage baseplate assembly protein V
MSGADLTELNRRIANLISVGRIESVDYARATARVRIGDIVTGDLPMPAARAGGNRSWAPLEVGEQVVVVAPSGNLSAGTISHALYSDDGAAPGDRAGLHRTVYSNGAVVEFDRDAGTFTLDLAGGSLVINAPGGLTITGDVTLSGSITSTGDVVAGGISLMSHIHPESIGSVTGGPQ